MNDALAKFKAGGINVYTVGVIYTKEKKAVDAIFAYTKSGRAYDGRSADYVSRVMVTKSKGVLY
jgi:hypothetical protein